jgi:hypothetical protein
LERTSAFSQIGSKGNSPISKICEIRTISDVTDYRAVLVLRHLAYSLVGKADPNAAPSVMADRHDQNATIVAAFHQGKAVGSVRIIPTHPDVVHEYEQLLDLPASIPAKHSLATVSRVCTHPDYRGSDLFSTLMMAADQTVRLLNRRFALGSCSDSLLRIYVRIGWTPTGVFLPSDSQPPEQLLLKDVRPT